MEPQIDLIDAFLIAGCMILAHFGRKMLIEVNEQLQEKINEAVEVLDARLAAALNGVLMKFGAGEIPGAPQVNPFQQLLAKLIEQNMSQGNIVDATVQEIPRKSNGQFEKSGDTAGSSLTD